MAREARRAPANGLERAGIVFCSFENSGGLLKKTDFLLKKMDFLYSVPVPGGFKSTRRRRRRASASHRDRFQVTVHSAGGPVYAGDGRGCTQCQAESSPLAAGAGERQPVTVTVTVRFQVTVHSAGGPVYAGDGWGCLQCQADSSSHDDAGGRALSVLRAGRLVTLSIFGAKSKSSARRSSLPRCSLLGIQKLHAAREHSHIC